MNFYIRLKVLCAPGLIDTLVDVFDKTSSCAAGDNVEVAVTIEFSGASDEQVVVKSVIYNSCRLKVEIAILVAGNVYGLENSLVNRLRFRVVIDWSQQRAEGEDKRKRRS